MEFQFHDSEKLKDGNVDNSGLNLYAHPNEMLCLTTYRKGSDKELEPEELFVEENIDCVYMLAHGTTDRHEVIVRLETIIGMIKGYLESMKIEMLGEQ